MTALTIRIRRTKKIEKPYLMEERFVIPEKITAKQLDKLIKKVHK